MSSQPPDDQVDQTLLEDCSSLFETALRLWKEGDYLVADAEAYIELMRKLVCIDNLLNFACGPSRARPTNLREQIQTVQEAIPRDPIQAAWDRILLLEINLIPDVLYLHTGSIQVDATNQIIRMRARKTGEVSLKDLLLATYDGTISMSVGVLDNPTLYFISADGVHVPSERMESQLDFRNISTYVSMRTLESHPNTGMKVGRRRVDSTFNKATHLLVGTNPRVHLTCNSGFYTLIKPAKDIEVIFKGASGDLCPCSEIRISDPRSALVATLNYPRRWRLYQLKRGGEPNIDAVELVPVVLNLTEQQRAQTTTTVNPQTLLIVWEHIVKLEEKAGESSSISWLIELAPFNDDYPMMARPIFDNQEYATEHQLNTLAKKWGCEMYFGTFGPKVFHCVLGVLFRGKGALGSGSDVPSEGHDHAVLTPESHLFIKDVRDLRTKDPHSAY